MSGIWAKYNAALAAKPLQTKMFTSLTGFVLGDLVAQSPDWTAGKPYDFWRTTKLALFGFFLHGPIGHYWYGFLDRTVMPNNPKSAAAVITKTGIDQIFWAPIFTSGFFAIMKGLDGKFDEIKPEIETKLIPTLKVNYMTWIPAHIVNFALVPSSQRVLYINVIQVGYNAFLSTMQASETKTESKGLAQALDK
mmetsp:Transcript_12299/g.21005  ORF Transcript_12299/g.21005 Transcript_12299/m.21005 type:complete len:193 (-) Transcript_12299:177-755(-)|eukprot:CAMPEP_0184692788 /NCGR_PEP_ID=MMETSP0313-20130426/1108_1 /TAXON_ID=2792 /ORGANISM="Porphyridium aerugineum, Strain SAG 1380-2" /LENGTH=192 /DNA_ID=CAMNT_0027150637 /DNA_START=211 /DNA_END=789 /DNA_ORIENTATION=-